MSRPPDSTPCWRSFKSPWSFAESVAAEFASPENDLEGRKIETACTKSAEGRIDKEGGSVCVDTV